MMAAMKVAVSRAPGAERDVSPLELFFDLVYVFAIGQLSHHLLEHVDLRTGAETAVLALAVFYAWYMTAWGANWLEPDRLPVRALLVGLMFASLLMSAGTDEGVGAVGLWGTWTLALIVLALIAVAVGDELAIAHPGDDATRGFTILTFGGPALFLLAQAVFHREALGHAPRSRPLGIAALAILAVATAPLAMTAGIAAAAAVLLAVALADTARG
jgi:low temperature requirement protein LtrA